MANYTALDSYSVFTPPKNQFFASNVDPTPIPVQPSPAPSSAGEVGSQSDYVMDSVGVSADPSYDHYLKSKPIRDDDFQKMGATSESSSYGYYSGSPNPDPQPPQPFIPRSVSESQIESHSATPALSQMYAMKRK